MTFTPFSRCALASLLVLLPLSLACGSKTDDTGTGGGTTDGGTTDGGTTDGGGTDGGGTDGGADGGGTDGGGTDGGGTDGGAAGVSFSITGQVLDMATLMPTGEGLCAYALDPTAPLGGSGAIDPETDIVAATTVGAKGVFSLDGVVMPSLVGMFVLVSDCEGEAPTVLPSATGIPYEAYATLSEGDVIETPALLITGTFVTTIESSIAALGEKADLASEGAMVGFVYDQKGSPVAGATVTCTDCPTTWYFDANPAQGGLFANGRGEPNTGTSPAAGGAFLIVDAPIATYTVTDPAGKLTWDPALFGSLPGVAAFVSFVAN